MAYGALLVASGLLSGVDAWVSVPVVGSLVHTAAVLGALPIWVLLGGSSVSMATIAVLGGLAWWVTLGAMPLPLADWGEVALGGCIALAGAGLLALRVEGDWQSGRLWRLAAVGLALVCLARCLACR